MGRKKHLIKAEKKEKRLAKMRKLDEYDTRGYVRDLEYLGRLNTINENTKSWIEVTMYELRGRANKYEHMMGELLIKNKIDFIHQAPFVFRPKKIYFADFFLPQQRIVIEVDGIYHQGEIQANKDHERDYNFQSVGIRLIRVHNEELLDTKRLALRLSPYLKLS